MNHDRIIAALITVVGAAYLVAALTITEPTGGYAAVGPRVFPILIGVGMLVSAIWLALGRSSKTIPQQKMDWPTWAATAVLIPVYILLLEPVGYLITTAVFLFAQARILGSRAWLRDGIISVVMTGTVYAVFNGILKKGLPSGLLG